MRKFFRNLFIVFVILIALILALWGGKYIFYRNYVILDGKPCSRRITSLDLSGQAEVDLDTLAELKNLQHLDLRGTGITLGEHEWLQRQIPQCKIDWEVLFQGTYGCRKSYNHLSGHGRCGAAGLPAQPHLHRCPGM